jgi:site-specific DNA-methyltransferase (adenine-specific)
VVWKKNWKGHTNKRIHTYTDKGGASRFFYVAKASKSERNKGLEGFEQKQVFGDDGGTYQGLSNSKLPSSNFHPTVKPIKLMQYLVRLVTPPNGIVLDPFVGSGTTGIAAKLEGFNFVGIEQDAEYCKIAQSRIENYEEQVAIKKIAEKEAESENQLKLF